MENQGILLYIGIALIILLVLWYIWTANNLIAKRNRVKQCRSGICVALKQRNDMIPNLVAAVKSYMGHENETLTRIAELRSRTFQPSQESEQIKTGNELSSLISKLQLSVEDYPELKASEQFTRLQRNIEDMELQLQAIRRTYNAAVTDYNNSIEMFPSSIVAGRQNHHQEELIDIPEQEQRNVDVSALLKRCNMESIDFRSLSERLRTELSRVYFWQKIVRILSIIVYLFVFCWMMFVLFGGCLLYTSDAADEL